MVEDKKDVNEKVEEKGIEKETEVKEVNEASENKKENAKKKRDNFLTKEARAAIRERLIGLGLSVEPDMTDDDLVKKLTDTAEKLNEQVIKKEAGNLQQRLNAYAATADSIIKDKIFIERLLNLNVPHIYLKLFRDQDANLTDKQIWQRIRESGIEPLTKHQKSSIFTVKDPLSK